MRTPWYCPYCKMPSNRRWNVSVHIQRKHPGHYNPMPELKQNPPFSAYFSQPQNQSSNPPFSAYFSQPQNQSSNPPFSAYFSQPQNQSSNSNTSRDDSFDPVQLLENSTKIQNILREIRPMNKIERLILLSAISNLPN
jgi:hypothetical protein